MLVRVRSLILFCKSNTKRLDALGINFEIKTLPSEYSHIISQGLNPSTRPESAARRYASRLIPLKTSSTYSAVFIACFFSDAGITSHSLPVTASRLVCNVAPTLASRKRSEYSSIPFPADSDFKTLSGLINISPM